MTRWENSEEEEDRCALIDTVATSWTKHILAKGFQGGQVTGMVTQVVAPMASGDVSSSVAECSSTSEHLNGTHNGKEDEYDFDSTENQENEAEPSPRPSSWRSGYFGRNRNSGVSTSTSDNERPSSSGIPNGLVSNSQFQQARAFGNGHSPSPSSSASSGAGSVHGGNAAFMNRFPSCSSTTQALQLHSPNSLARSNSDDWIYPTPGDVGLNNAGNTCFMNSGLQCLVHTPTLVQFFLNLDLSTVRNPPEPNSVLSQFQIFMQHVWFGIISPINTTNFRNALGRVHSQFTDGLQHDCQEFLALMLGTLHDQLKELSKPPKKSIDSGKFNGEDPATNESVSSSAKKNNTAHKKYEKMNGHKRNGDSVEKNKRKRTKFDSKNGHDSDGNDSGTEDPPENSGHKTADDYWKEHLAANDTVLTYTYQGLLKSTVVCGECANVSITYEPFTYLSVPIPNIRKLSVSYMSLKHWESREIRVTLSTDETVRKLKELLAAKIPEISNSADSQNLVLAEVANHNIARRLDEDMHISYVNDTRKIYLYELNQNFIEKYGASTNASTLHGIFSNNSSHYPSFTKSFVGPTYAEDAWNNNTERELPALIPVGTSSDSTALLPLIGPLPQPQSPATAPEVRVEETEIEYESESTAAQLTNGSKMSMEMQCLICLDDLPVPSLLKHKVCGAVLCNECLPRAATFYCEENKGAPESSLKCPTCLAVVKIEDFRSFSSEPSSQLNLVGLLLRLPADSNNNASLERLFGAPRVLRIPATIPAEELQEFVSSFNPFPHSQSTLVNVLADGLRCVRCSQSENCDGCPIANEGSVSIIPGTALAFSYTQISKEDIASMKSTVKMPLISSSTPSFTPPEPVIDIHDCIRSFSEVEHMDAENLWHCDKCAKKQPATKTLTISRLPDCLIIHLKRFTFVNNNCLKLENKVRFPLVNLDMNPYVGSGSEGTNGKSKHIYDLYSCVCHFGFARSGHYSAYSRNPVTELWSRFNDSSVTREEPTESDYKSAYVLFYQRKDLRYDIPKRSEETIIRNSPTPPRPPTPMGSPSHSQLRPASYSDVWNSLEPASTAESLIDPSLDTARLLIENEQTEVNFSASGNSTIHNFPHVSSSEKIGSPLLNSFGDEEGFEADFLSPAAPDSGVCSTNGDDALMSLTPFTEEEMEVSTSTEEEELLLAP